MRLRSTPLVISKTWNAYIRNVFLLTKKLTQKIFENELQSISDIQAVCVTKLSIRLPFVEQCYWLSISKRRRKIPFSLFIFFSTGFLLCFGRLLKDKLNKSTNFFVFIYVYEKLTLTINPSYLKSFLLVCLTFLPFVSFIQVKYPQLSSCFV